MRLRSVPAAAAVRIRAHGPSLLLAAGAAGLAHLVASLLFGAQNAVFAPVAAVVSIGLAAGQRIRRATEISLGVVLGIVAATLLTTWLGAGPLQIALAVLLAMSAAVAVRPSGLMANQAAVAAVVVIALVPYLDAGPWVRLGDALVGGFVAVVLNALFSPDPVRAARTATTDVLAGLEQVLGHVVGALERDALDEAEAALDEMVRLDGARAEIQDALTATRERLLWTPRGRRGRATTLRAVTGVTGRVVVMLATVRALCRAAANLVRHADIDPHTRTVLVQATEELTDAVAELRDWVAGSGSEERVRERALGAAATASGLLPARQHTAVFVGQLRGVTVDLLRAIGETQVEAVRMLEEAAGRAGEFGG